MTSETPPGAGRPPAESPASLLAFVDALLEREAIAPPPGVVVQRSFLDLVVGEERYFLPLLVCREIARVPEIARIPEGPPGVRGMASVRGKVLPVLDARVCLGRPPAAPSPKARLVLVEEQQRIIALLVDRVAGIVKVDESAILPPRPTDPAYVAGQVTQAGRPGLILSFTGLLTTGKGPRADGEG